MKKSEIGKLVPKNKYKYKIDYTNQFKKDVIKAKKSDCDLTLLDEAIKTLAKKGTLPKEYRPHKLSGNYAGYWEAHIKGDWLLVWLKRKESLTLILTNTGTHSEIFG